MMPLNYHTLRLLTITRRVCGLELDWMQLNKDSIWLLIVIVTIALIVMLWFGMQRRTAARDACMPDRHRDVTQSTARTYIVSAAAAAAVMDAVMRDDDDSRAVPVILSIIAFLRDRQAWTYAERILMMHFRSNALKKCHAYFAEMLKKPRGQNFGLGLGLVTSGLGLRTLWPRPQAFGLGLEL